jgi:hypothetical protein
MYQRGWGDPPLVNQELLAAGLNRARPHDAGLLEVLNERMGLMTTRDEAMAHKQKAATAQAAAAVKIWNVTVVSDAAAAADFLNLPTAQVAGEAFASNRADGQVDLYYFM